MSRIGLGIALIVVWVLLWGDPSPANLLSGLAVVLLLYAVFPSNRPIVPTIRFRPVALGRLVAYFLVNVVRSNVVLSRTILSRHARVCTGVVKVQMHTNDVMLLTMITNITALTPGSMVVQLDTDRQRPLVKVHVLTPGDPMVIARNLLRLEDLCVRAVGSEEQIARLGRHPTAAGPVDPVDEDPS